MVSLVPVLLAGALSFIFGWNNGSFLIGNLRGSGSLKTGTAVLVSGIGLLAGAIAEGPKMTTSLVGSMVSTAGYSELVVTLISTTAILLVLSLAGRPMSLSMTAVGAFLGAVSGAGLAVNADRTSLVVGFWFLAPLATACLTYVIYQVLRSSFSSLPLATVVLLNRTGAITSALFVSYTLGANNLGLLQSTVIASDPNSSQDLFVLSVVAIALALAAVAGAGMLGRGAVSGMIGDKLMALSPQGAMTVFIASALVVWVGTQFALPISIAQCVLGGMFGASMAKKPSVMNKKLVVSTLVSWVVVPAAAAALSFSVIVLA